MRISTMIGMERERGGSLMWRWSKGGDGDGSGLWLVGSVRPRLPFGLRLVTVTYCNTIV
jgi:hypothetical protein